MSATIKDIAKETHLSVGTISNYINGKSVSEKNKVIIEDAIKKLNYSVNYLARNLKNNRSKLIGVILPKLEDIFALKIISFLEDFLRVKGYSLLVNDTKDDLNIEKDVINFYLQRRVEGVILFPKNNDMKNLMLLCDKNIPIICMDKVLPQIHTDVITLDNALMMKKAVNYLIEQGHTKIGVLAGPDSSYTANERLVGYKEALLENNLPINEDYIKRGVDSEELIATQMAESLIDTDVTVIVATNYFFTLGVLMACNTKEKMLGTDISLLGFDDFLLTKIIKPKLTIIQQPLEEMAHMAVDLLLKKIHNVETENIIHKLKGRLIEGKSIVRLK